MTERKSGVSVILPSFNEAVALPRLVEEILKIHEKHFKDQEFQIIIIDDNSPDRTAEIILDKFRDEKKVKLIVRKNEKGLASAVLRGIRESDTEHVLVMDCDFNHPPQKIIELVKNAMSYDVVCYSRYVKDGGMNTDNKLFRFWGSKLYNKFLQIYLGLETNDNLSGFFIIRKNDILKLPTDVIFDGYGEFYFGILYFMKKMSGQTKILQLPIVYEKRMGGESKTKFFQSMLQYFKKARLFKKYDFAKEKSINNLR